MSTPTHAAPPIVAGLAWVALALTAFAAYVVTGADTIVGGDNAEFVALMQTGGLAHPPGYPLYTLILRAVGLVSASPFSATVVTCVIGASAVVVVGRAIRAWGGSHFSALLLASVYAFSGLAWKLSSHAEVFALNALLVAAIVWLSGPLVRLRPLPRVALLGVLAGLGLANHHSSITVAPVGLTAIIIVSHGLGGTPAALGVAAKRWGAAVSCCCVALAIPYLLVAILPGGPGWGELETLGDFWHHFRRADYGTFNLAAGGTEQSSWLARELDLGRHVLLDLLIAPALAGVWGLWELIRRPRGVEAHSRADTALAVAFVVAVIVAGPGLVALFNLAPHGLNVLVLERFYLLPQLLVCVAAARGWDALSARLRLSGQMRVVLLVACIITGLVLAGPAVARYNRPDVSHFLEDTLMALPPNTVLLGVGDRRLFGYHYLQRCRGLRPDVTYVDPQMLHLPWYHARVREALGVELPGPRGGSLDTVELTEAVLATGRPVHLASAFAPEVLQQWPTFPLGATIVVIGDQSERPPHPRALEELNLEVYKRYRVVSPPPLNPSWAAAARTDLASTWISLGDLYQRLGYEEAARRCYSRAEVLAPWVEVPGPGPVL